MHRAKFCRGGKSPQKCIYSVPAQETAKHRAQFGWPLVNDVTALMNSRRETRCNLLGCPKLLNQSQPLMGRSSPYYADVWRTCCCLTSFFPMIDKCLSCEATAQQSCEMVRRWRFLRPEFPASREQHISDLHSKFALTPHHV